MDSILTSISEHKQQIISDLRQDLKLDPGVFDWDNYLKLYGDHLIESLNSGKTVVFSDFLAWSTSIGQNFAINELENDIITNHLTGLANRYLTPDEYSGFDHFITHCRKQAEGKELRSSTFLSSTAPHGNLSIAYFEALMEGDRHTAGNLVMDSVSSGIHPREIFLHVFQPGLREVGRLWHKNVIGVGQEHFFSAATQMIISRLYPQIFNSKRINKQMIAMAVGGELHEIGIRMVSDFFEMEGWDTLYLGANCPDSEIIRELERVKPDLLAISVTMTSHIGRVRNLVSHIRSIPGMSDLKIMAGGRIFLERPELFDDINANAFANDAEDAVNKARILVN